MQFSHGSYDIIYLHDLIDNKQLKTGDIILFKAANNFNAIYFAHYFTHIGIVYVDTLDEHRTPYLFEANGIDVDRCRSFHGKNGIFFTPLRGRIAKYKGRCWLKALNHPINETQNNNFRTFIDYCLKNMTYNMKILHSVFQKLLGISKCNKSTNCAEIVFLSLIKLGLLDIKQYDLVCGHYLKFVTNITKCQNQYAYEEPIEIIDHMFDDSTMI